MVSAFSCVMLSSIYALILSPTQIAERDIGRFECVVALPDPAPPGVVPGGGARVAKGLKGAGATETSVYQVVFGLSSVASGRGTVALEADWARAPFGDRYVLTSGRWPSHPGEVAVSGVWAPQTVELLAGDIQLKRTGTVEDKFDEQAAALFLGVGTWASWSPPDVAVRNPGLAAQSSVLWSGVSSASRADEAITRGSGDAVGIREANCRSQVLSARVGTAGPLPWSLMLPILMLPAVGAISSASIARRWASRRRDIMWSVGLADQSISRALIRAAVRLGAGATAVGIAVGVLLAVAARPLVANFSTQVLSPVWPQPAAIFAVAGTSFVGVLAGLLVQMPTLPVRREAALGWRRTRFTLAAMALVGFLAFARQPSGTADVVALCVMALGMVALLLPDLWRPILGMLPVRSYPGTLGVRMLLAANATTSLAVSIIVVALGLGITVPTVMASASVTTNAETIAEMPPGYLQVTSIDNGKPVPSQIRSEVEKHLGVDDPVKSYLLFAVSPREQGVITLFEDVPSAERWLGHPLDEAGKTCLVSGCLLTAEPLGALPIALAEAPGNARTIDTVATDVPIELAANTYGIALTRLAAQMGVGLGPASYTYTGLSPEAVIRSLSASTDLGISSGYLSTSRPPDRFEIPVALQAAILGLTVIPVLIIAAFAKSQARALRPSLAALRAIGLPNAWALRVLTTQLATLVVVSALAAIGALSLALVLAKARAPDFIVVIPPLAVMGTCVSLTLGLGVGILAGLRGLRVRERTI